MQTLFILGRQPALGRAELESLYGAGNLRPVGAGAVLGSLAPAEVNFARLGGSVKLAEVLETVGATDWRQLQTAVVRAGSSLAEKITEGKIQLGVSAYDLRVSPAQLNAGGLELKKALRGKGRSVRLIPNQTTALNSAQVLHNHLTGDRGIEIVLVRDGDKTILARTLAEQDIDAYTERDRGRPKRDARVGMLPPKLAQIIINLAVGKTPASPNATILDPFCGTGVVLQEALLMGYGVYGTDLEPRMIDYTTANLEWLRKLPSFSAVTGVLPASSPFVLAKAARAGGPPKAVTPDSRAKLEVGDAMTHIWQLVPDFIVCETYLGQPYNTVPPREKLGVNIRTCNLIIEKFLKNVAAQLEPGMRLCLAVPAWQHKSGQFIHLPLLDHLSDLGYNRIDFRYAQRSELLYYRPDQVVARELLVITRK